ncbi:hypothetical protein ACIGN6_04600 [Streptomyces sp. NPDC053792]|uniref:hypothetical protein n=1 Tax=unclassified Streptomyces TaxID=2593676 RepID=UPI003437193E
MDLARSVVDQLVAVRLLDRLPEARGRRRAEPRGQRDAAEAPVHRVPGGAPARTAQSPSSARGRPVVPDAAC